MDYADGKFRYKITEEGWLISEEDFGDTVFSTYEEAKGNIVVCPAYRNSESKAMRNWSHAYDWFDVSSHLRVTEE